MLRVKELNVAYEAFHALSGISFSIEEGEIVALLGGNGAGKTTTINTISGTLSPWSGTIEFLGKDITKVHAYERVMLGIVQVPEGRKLFPQMSVMDNMLVGSYLKHTHSKRKETAQMCFEFFPKLYERRNQLAGSLSGGEQQMCAIARALMQHPKLLMLDEPSLGLAPVVVDQVFEVIQRINKQGTTILLVEQNARASLEIADRGYLIETGHDVMNGSSAELLGDPLIKEVYIGL